MNIDVLLVEQLTGQYGHGGVARYIRHMIAALNNRFNDGFAACSELTDLPHSTQRVFMPDLRFRGMYHLGLGRLLLAAQTYFLNRLITRIRPRLVFCPYFGPIANGAPQVFTVYDFLRERYPQYFVRRFLPAQLARMQKCYGSAAAIFCISESTRRDLLRLYPFVDSRKAYVTHLGVDDAFFNTEVNSSANEGPYILYVGNRAGWKNFMRLLESFAASGVAHEYQLKVVTPRRAAAAGWTRAESDFIRRSDLISRISLETSVTEDRLRQLYRGAEFFVYPSEYEGFGLPILEAMASRTLVLCSNTSSMPEIGGDAVVYFDPLDVSSISNALQYAARLSPVERHFLVEKGVARARSFNWATCATKTISIFESLLRNTR